ncbi:M1 family metallopeptidase [Streptomyces sp. NPDC057638]|uniref:M1 family metallopeptidase n=1 Tax=Streptomyces sp. NPDC057638 TaxID=3346190 RepID=UPI00369E53FC
MDTWRLRRGLAPAALVFLTACLGPGPYGSGPAPGAPGVGDPLFPGLGNGGYDVRHYGLTLVYDPATRHLTGTADITARATQHLSSFRLDLRGLAVREVTVQGERAGVKRVGDELVVRPRNAVPEGGELRTVVRYSGRPGAITDPDGSEEGWIPTADGAIAVGEPAGSMAWFPGNHHPTDKATYTLAITVPRGLTAVSNGALTRRTESGSGTTFVWDSDRPMASYLATLAIGRYELLRGTAPGANRNGREGTPVITAAHTSVPARGRALLARVPEIVRWATRTFGPFPFSTTGATLAPAGSLGYALETQTRPVLPSDRADLPTLVHEIAHEWYGNAVSPRSWKDMWLNESFATYAEWLWAEESGGVPVEDSFRAAYERADNWAFPPADPPSAAEVSGAPVYGRGAMVLHRVREELGEGLFRRLLVEWPRDRRDGNASTAEFTAYVEKLSGKDLDAVWKTWLYGTGRPPRS